ncbi:LysR family transcriptional regulator [Delftia sp. HK171]|uniref:LysR family transcriptional regulator n=1 Tax=Delftia sp. HK171 TaxID=1920191 RepID=UPI000904528F|nr:LysR family transcriptional regulator [Delftia sp. HK171]APE49262.1 LysR family transcriptional regulator [Delftia sp. HK171]
MEWTLDRLKHFVAVAEAGTMTEAARRLGRAQSAVSTAIGLLEADLGLELFDRVGRRVQLTAAGEVMLLEARSLLHQAQAMDHRARALTTGGQARLAVALDEALPYVPLAQLFKELAARFPAMELTVLNGTASEVAGHVAAQRAQVAFQFDRAPAPATCAQRHIGSVPQTICVAKGHVLDGTAALTRRQLAAHRQLLMHIEGVEDTVLSPAVWRSNSFYVIADMVADGLGWAILPVNIAEFGDLRPHLRQRACEGLALPPLTVRMLWLEGLAPGAEALWMRQRLAELLALMATA